MKLNTNEILKLINDGYIIQNKHPEKDLFILNYSKKCQYEQYWNNTTLSCRGLIVDFDFNVIGRSYKKFFNYEEISDKEWFPKNPISDYEIYTKEDGSLGILFNYNDEWIVASRGSFISEQAIKATEMLKKYNISQLDKSNSYLFEIIYPSNMIVINYFGKETLILHGIIRNNDGYLFTYDELINYVRTIKIDFDIIKQHNFVDDILVLKNRNIKNEEGYVLRLKNTDFLMKLKFETYIKQHSIITNISSKVIWKCLRDNLELNKIIDVIPDEVYGWVKKWEIKLTNSFEKTEKLNKKIYDEIINEIILNEKQPTNKEFALLNLSIKKGNPSIRFKMFEKKPYSEIIWKLIEPEYEKPFQFNDDND